MIKFNEAVKPRFSQPFSHHHGDGKYTKLCCQWFENRFNVNKVLLTTSCTHALEMAAILLDIKPGDEVIIPSYTFVSTANAFVLRGAKIVFVDIRPDTMNIDEKLIEAAITPKTKVIVPVHYAGVACAMDEIMALAKKYNIFVVEDAAQGVMSTYKGKALGSMGDIGCYSFHATKNYSMGEGGALLINNQSFIERAEIIREKGTNRSNFLRGQVDKYTWVDVGSSYLPSDILAAYLWEQLQRADEINEKRLHLWSFYNSSLKDLMPKSQLPFIPEYVKHNAHMFYVKCHNIEHRAQAIAALTDAGMQSAFHYVPLHSSPAGLKYGEFVGKDIYTTSESEKILRLPMHYYLESKDVQSIITVFAQITKSMLYTCFK